MLRTYEKNRRRKSPKFNCRRQGQGEKEIVWGSSHIRKKEAGRKKKKAKKTICDGRAIETIWAGEGSEVVGGTRRDELIKIFRTE